MKRVLQFSPIFVAVGLVAIAALAGCGDRDSEVRRYRVPKAAPQAASRMPSDHPPIGGGGAMSPGGAISPGSPAAGAPKARPARFTWDLPKGWVESKGSSMRLASFRVPLPNDATGDLSVVELGGGAGGMVANVNRWRGQVGLGDAAADAVLGALEDRTSPLGPYKLVKLVNPAHDNAIIGGIYEGGGRTLFIKMTLPRGAMDAAAPDFTAFCDSVGRAKKTDGGAP